MVNEYTQKQISKKIQEHNTLSEIKNEVVPKLNELLKDFVGAKIQKKDHDLMKKFKVVIDKTLRGLESDGLTLWCYSNGYNLQLNINKFISGLGYVKGSYYLGNVINSWSNPEDNGILKDVGDFKRIEHIDENEQLYLFDKCRDLKEQYEEKKKQLKPYGLGELL